MHAVQLSVAAQQTLAGLFVFGPPTLLALCWAIGHEIERRRPSQQPIHPAVSVRIRVRSR